MPEPQIPDGLRMAAYRAARDWAAEHRHQQPDDRMVDAVLAAVYPLLQAQWEAVSEWALWAARQALDVAADGAEQMTVERAEARDEQED